MSFCRNPGDGSYPVGYTLASKVVLQNVKASQSMMGYDPRGS